MHVSQSPQQCSCVHPTAIVSSIHQWTAHFPSTPLLLISATFMSDSESKRVQSTPHHTVLSLPLALTPIDHYLTYSRLSKRSTRQPHFSSPQSRHTARPYHLLPFVSKFVLPSRPLHYTSTVQCLAPPYPRPCPRRVKSSEKRRSRF
jgi:hypothetical protein